MKCRCCKGGNLFQFLDLGHHPPSDQFKTHHQLAEPETIYPLQVFICEDCGLPQLGYIVPPQILYQDNYPYEASVTRTGKTHFNDFATSVINQFQIGKNDFVVDIGSNVGVLLSGFQSHGTRVLGVDPAKNIADIAVKNGIPTIADFFNSYVAQKIVEENGQANVITGTNVFAHIDDWDSLTKAILVLLKKGGVFIIEAPHFLHLVNSLEYDTIYHEHLSYITVEPLISFFKSYDLDIIKIENHDIHGGSIRIFISRKGDYIVHESVADIIALEKLARLRDKDVLSKFAFDVNKNRQLLNSLLWELKSKGKRIVGVSAPAKGMTLLNYCKIGCEILDYITEKSRLKIGLYSPGGHIPIYEDSKLVENKPDFALLLAWNFANEIIANLSEFRKNGGKFIIPIPQPIII